MEERSSLFARKLRAYRADTAGGQGRMTQEQLADRLGVSVDAVGKYERSVSFIRGDFEHRLVERLGWNPEDVAACRRDWDANHLPQRRNGYRAFDGASLIDLCGSAAAANEFVFDLLNAQIRDIPNGFSAPDARWAEMLERAPTGCLLVMDTGGTAVGYWALYVLARPHEAAFRDLTFREVDLDIGALRRPVLPGRYFAYCPALVVVPGHEAVTPLLLSTCVSYLEEMAARDVFLNGIGATAVSPEGRQFCEDLGCDLLGRNVRISELTMWELPGHRIAGSIFGRRSAALRRAYGRAFGSESGMT